MRIHFWLIFMATMFTACSQTNKNLKKENHKYTNDLIHETSPYLLQHAHNPVNWAAWNDKTLAKAKEENKLILISIGYAACHWCHVMEHESFEDEEVAAIMNNNFIPIKVDREERPDVDDVYMTACNIVTGRGGWPLNAIALPDGRPVFAGTYYQKDQWINILNQVSEMYENNPEKLLEAAEGITSGIKNADIIETTEETIYTQESLDKIIGTLLKGIDYKHGGNNRTPRFPMPNNFELIQKYHWMKGDSRSLEANNITLTQMGRGGIYDQLGGGFARYSVDGVWKVPHFEKMLYDNGQLLGLYADGYKITKDEYYKKIALETYDFLIRELKHKQGGYYSSLDADSEGEEGKFYVWKTEELDSLLGNNSEIYKDYYSITRKGNWEHNNILHITDDPLQIAKKHKLSIDELDKLIERSNLLLMQERDNRIRPGLDDKILCSWNALVIDGFLRMYEAFGDSNHYDSAVETTNFLLENLMMKDGSLKRNYKNGEATISGFLDDYALFIKALIRLYQNDFDEKWLDKAQLLVNYVITHFKAEDQSLFYYTSDKDAPLIVRKIEYSDNVIPASNSVMANNLNELGNLLYNTAWIEMSKNMLKAVYSQASVPDAAGFYSNWLQLFLNQVQSPYEIAIVGSNAETLRKELAAHYLGNSLVLGASTESKLPLLEGKYEKGETKIFVCQNKSCKFPVLTVNEALALMKN